ncbi:MAG: hypothetical protein NT149_02560 [Candidatus Gottesmanbacteria bacterium]|nr:hypothetical protein [Candidatus Gottesmanbacteria bacterium]
MRKILTSPVFWIIVLAALPLWALLVPGLPVTHDGVDHVARIANFYRSLTEGNVIPRWAGSLNWGYGHPILMFLYPLPSYMASLFHWVGVSLVDSTKMVFGLGLVASALTMYLWMKTAFGKNAGIAGALLYVFAPYRFVDLYVRGAIGEHVAFIFPPLILFFLYKRKYILFSFALAALILSHNAIALMFLPIIVLYALYVLIFESKNKLLFTMYFLLFTLLGFGLSAFFWIPAYFEGKYTLRDIVTSGEASGRFVPWSWFIYSPWNYGQGDSLTKSLGIMQWAGVVSAVAVIWKTMFTKIRVVLLSSLGILFISFFIMTSWSRPIWLAVTALQKFQFPWRFLSVSVFASAVMGGIAAGELLKHKKTGPYIMTALCLLIIIVTTPMWHPKAYVMHDESFYSGIYLSTTDTGESSPVWSVRFMEHTAASPIQVISGEAHISVGKRTTTRHQYTINVMKPSRIVENTLYFPQWRVYIDGIPTGVEFQDPDYRGLITFRVASGNHSVVVAFENTKMRTVAERISLAALVIIGVSGLAVTLWRKRT